MVEEVELESSELRNGQKGLRQIRLRRRRRAKGKWKVRDGREGGDGRERRGGGLLTVVGLERERRKSKT